MTTIATSDIARRPSLLYRLGYTPLRDLLRGRLTARLDLDALVAQAGLPARLAELVLETVRRTRLWRLEQVDVTRELVAHFQDGLDAGASAEELVASFGDWKQAARLIRRAKKRQRPAAWKTFMRVGQAIGLALLLVVAVPAVVYGVQAARIYRHSPNVARDFLAEWNEAALAVPESDRAWPIYCAAVSARGRWPELSSYTDLEPGGEKWPEVAAFAAENREAIELCRRAAALPSLGAVLGPAADEPDESPPFHSVPVPQGIVLREAARLVAVDAYLAATEGDGARAAANIEALCGMVEHAYQMRIFIMDCVALSIADWASTILGTLLHDYPQLFDDARLTELAHRLAGLGGTEGLRVTFASEYAELEDLIQRYYTDDGRGDGLPRPELLDHLEPDLAFFEYYGSRWPGIVRGRSARVLTPALSVLMAGRRETLTKGYALLARCEALARVPLWQRQAHRDVYEEIQQEIDPLWRSPVAQLRYLPITTLTHCASSYATLRAEYKMQIRDATLTAIALELYRRHHGSWPVCLSELTPRFLPQVPPDRYDGAPLKYRLIDGQPRLYSVGVNRNDDGGRVPPPGGAYGNRRASQWRPMPCDDECDGDWLLWPPAK